MTASNIEKHLQDITNPDKTGLPSIIAITKLRRAIEKGAVIPDEYAHVDDIFLAQKRGDCLQAMGTDAWEKAQDTKRDFRERLELLKSIEGYKDKGDFGWQVFGITERDFYWHKTILEVSEFNQGFEHETDYYAASFDQEFNEHRLRHRLERNTVLSEEDVNAIIQMCADAKSQKYDEMKAANMAEYGRLLARAEDEAVTFADRIEALHNAQRQIGNFYNTASDAEKQKSRDIDTKCDALFKDHFQSRYTTAVEGDNALISYDALVQLDEDASSEGYELDQILEIEWSDFYKQQRQFLYNAADELIEKTNKMVDEGEVSDAHYEFDEYFSRHMKALEDAEYDVTKIRDHRTKLLKVKTKSEFDTAVSNDDAFNRANQLGAFAPGGHMSGYVLDDLFGKDKADEMRDVARNAFVEIARDAVTKYEAGDDEAELYRANYWRAERFLKWPELTDDVDGLKARAERNGHSFDM